MGGASERPSSSCMSLTWGRETTHLSGSGCTDLSDLLPTLQVVLLTFIPTLRRAPLRAVSLFSLQKNECDAAVQEFALGSGVSLLWCCCGIL
ncbi:hypothetical protein INR49_017457, partial [Caranx melampygus]